MDTKLKKLLTEFDSLIKKRAEFFHKHQEIISKYNTISVDIARVRDEIRKLENDS